MPSITKNFSPEDADLAQLNWHYHNAGYIIRWFGTRSERRYKEFAHRIVLERKLGRKLKPGELCDHINRDKMDNRRENLRLADKSINAINSERHVKISATGHAGVYYRHSREARERGWRGSWYCKVQRRNRIVFERHFASKEEAIAARQTFLNNEIT